MLKWVFGADTGPFRQGLAKMRSDVDAFSGSIKAKLAGVFAVSVISAWGKAMLDQAGRVDDLAKRLDMSAESIQRIGYAAQLSGSDIENAAKGLTVLTRNLAEAERGSTAFDDAAKALGIDLGKMREMSPEEQLVELSRAYVAAADKGQALASVIQLMGRGGAELMPLLAEGPEVLKQKMEEAVVASDQQVARLAEMGDKLDRLKSLGLAAFAFLADGVQQFGYYLEWVLDMISGVGRETAGERLADKLTKLQYGDPDEEAEKQAIAEGEAAKAAAEEWAKAAGERKKLTEEIAKLEEEARMKALSLEEQITELRRKQAELAADGIFGGSLEARKQELEIAKQIADLEKQRGEQQKKDYDEIAEKSKTLAEAVKAEAEADKENRRASMTDAERLKDLKKEQADLIRQSREAEKIGNHLEAIEKRTEAKSLDGEISDLVKGMEKQPVPTIIAGDLRRIGGGGNAVSSILNPAEGTERRLDTAIDLLRSIDRKTRESGTSIPSAF